MSPSCFRDTAHAHKTLDGKVGDELKKSLDSKGLKVLAYWENGWRDVTNSRAPVKTPGDLKGLKIRTNNSPMNIAAFKNLRREPYSDAILRSPIPASKPVRLMPRNTLSTSCGQRNSMRYRNISPSLITPIRLCCW
ncbi:C4-dicarboxylate ABC transporter substrate-binding protein [Salmonella enterica subsp. enterica]|uniref:C4-dicarboxylate ABC transporter substrate-binding protein n=1 Tax=Salmonella enterica I TaxID=59201 RepID=A0A447TSJ2_SALET|nr:C4-dicarboxylate ABC transporter substrate-binding protein [Salmonella enterica subsp. enterica]